MRRNTIAMLCIVLLSASFIFSLSGLSIAASPSARSVRLPILATTALSTLDPIQSVDIAQYDLCNQIFEGLLTVDDKGKLAPGLAEWWEHSPDYKIWKFRLRDASFADDQAFLDGKGRKISADDVIYSFKRGLSPQRGSKGSFALGRAVLGAKDFSEGTALDVSGLRVLSSDTIEIELVAGDCFFPAALTVPATYIVPREAVDSYGSNFGRKPVGSGPFKLSQWNEGANLILIRNESYGNGKGKQPAVPQIDTFEFRFFRSEASMVAAFKNGEIDARPAVGADFATLPNGSWKETFNAQYPDASLVSPGWVLKLNLLAPQMGNERVFGKKDGLQRQALTQILFNELSAIDAFRGIGAPQQQLLPDVLTSADESPPPSLY